MVRTQDVTDSINEALSFLTANWQPLGKDFAKAYLFSFAVWLTLALAGVIVGVGAYFAFRNSPPVTLAIVLVGWGIIVLIVAALASRIVSSSVYNLLDARVRNAQTSVMEAASANALPMTRFIIVTTLIDLLVMAPFFILGAIAYLGIAVSVPGLGPKLGELVFDIIRLFMSIPLAIVSLFLAYSIYEVLIARRGVIESISSSVRMVRGNLFESFVLLFLLYFVRQLVMIPLLIVAAIVVLPLLFGTIFVGGVLGMSTVPGMAAMAIGIALTVLAIVAAGTALAVADALVTLPPVYYLWGRIRKREAGGLGQGQ